ncbi:MAG: flagellar basal body-associated FliL family protein [Sphingomonas fennica]
MSDAPAADAAPPKKGGKMKKMIVMAVAVLGLLGGGVAGGVYAAGSGMVGGGHAAEKEDPDRPKLVPKGEHGEHEGSGPPPKGDASPEDTGDYKATYYAMETPFTANLSDADGFLQIGLGVSTYYDEKVIENLKENDMPVRSAVLLVLAEQSAEALAEPEGKKHLQKVLTQTVNQVLREKAGFGGIDDVYFTSFVMQ